MNNLISYLSGRLGKKTCPIVSIDHVFNFDFNVPWKEWVEIKFKDGTVIQLMEKPK